MSSTTYRIPSCSASIRPSRSASLGRVPLRHEQPEDPLWSQRPGAQGGHHRAVDAAGDPDDGPASAEVAQDLSAEWPPRSRSATCRASIRRTFVRTSHDDSLSVSLLPDELASLEQSLSPRLGL